MGVDPWATFPTGLRTPKPHRRLDPAAAELADVVARDGKLRLRHFSRVRQLGSGDVGMVDLVQLVGGEQRYALKSLEKREMLERNKVRLGAGGGERARVYVCFAARACVLAACVCCWSPPLCAHPPRIHPDACLCRSLPLAGGAGAYRGGHPVHHRPPLPGHALWHPADGCAAGSGPSTKPRCACRARLAPRACSLPSPTHINGTRCACLPMHPLACPSHLTCADTHLHFLLEYCNGGEMYALLNAQPK